MSAWLTHEVTNKRRKESKGICMIVEVEIEASTIERNVDRRFRVRAGTSGQSDDRSSIALPPTNAQFPLSKTCGAIVLAAGKDVQRGGKETIQKLKRKGSTPSIILLPSIFVQTNCVLVQGGSTNCA